MKKIHIIPLLASAVALLTATGCSDEILVTSDSGLQQGKTVNAYLDLSVQNLAVSTATRTETPSSDPETDTEAERRVNNVWLFQYNADGELVYYTYVTGTHLEELDDLNVSLSDIGNVESTIYAVTNTDDATWVTESNKSSFGTIDLLQQQTIPNPNPIYATDLNAEGSTVGIPMSGSTSGVVVWEGSRITVPVTRMFAKMEMRVRLTTSTGYTASLTSVSVGNVPTTCSVGTVFTDDETAGTYSTDTKYYPWSFTSSQIIDVSEEGEDEDGYSVGYPYVMYVPENIKGENSNDAASTKFDNAPQNSLYVISRLNLTDDRSAQIVADPHYSVSPGGNITNNYNVRRNCVYRVTVTIAPKDVITPSANCLIAPTNTTIAFYPYYRDEIGHRDDNTDYADASYYDFEQHLSGDDLGLTLASLKIIWQTQDCIGNNSSGNLVELVTDDDDWMHTKIYVHAAKTGNALIGGYNSDGKLLWSWHIWVTDLAPDNDGNAVTYSHYLWDEDGIYTDKRVTGYPVMRCNLGALANEPASTAWSDYTKTYGTLYQWGRKDPFPPVKTNGKHAGLYNYDNATANVDVYDNSNTQIYLDGNTGWEGTTSAYSVFNTVQTTSLTQTKADGIQYSIEHPTTFIAATNTDLEYDETSYDVLANYENQGDWLPEGDDDLWGGNGKSTKRYQPYSTDNGDDFNASIEDNYGDYKTIFDPCPYGWRTAPGDLWLGFTKDGLNYNEYANSLIDAHMVANVNCVETTTAQVAANMGFHMYMNNWGSGDVVFFPTQGSRLASGQPFHGGICGNYHNATVDETVAVKDWLIDGDRLADTATPNAIRRVDILHFHNAGNQQYTQVNTFEKELIYYNRAVAGPVRCVREKTK